MNQKNMKQKEDMRSMKTKTLIKNAFLALMQEKPFEKITVADITDRASVHRGTFYTHYQDKYDLLEQIEQEIIDDMGEFIMLINYESLSQSLATRSPMPHMVPLLTYIEEHLDYFHLVMASSGHAFFDKMVETYFDHIVGNICWQEDEWVDYRKDVTRAVITSVLRRWVDNGMKEKKEDLAAWLTAMMFSNWEMQRAMEEHK